MKTLIGILVMALMGCGLVLTEGGKKQGETGSGNTSTGSDSQGSAQQDRAGR